MCGFLQTVTQQQGTKAGEGLPLLGEGSEVAGQGERKPRKKQGWSW